MQMETKSGRRARVTPYKLPKWLSVILAISIVGLLVRIVLPHFRVIHEEREYTDRWILRLITLDPFYMKRS